MLEALKRSMGSHYARRGKAPSHVALWLRGEIGDAEYLAGCRRWLERHGWHRAEDGWWPSDLFRAGAMVEKDNGTSVVYVRTTVPDKDRPGKTKDAWAPHPRFASWLEEEERENRWDAYVDHVVDDVGELF